MLLGAISATWVVMDASVGRAVPDPVGVLAMGITESLYYIAIALASWLAGQVYGLTPAHELPLTAGLAAMPAVLIVWLLPSARPKDRAARKSVDDRR